MASRRREVVTMIRSIAGSSSLQDQAPVSEETPNITLQPNATIMNFGVSTNEPNGGSAGHANGQSASSTLRGVGTTHHFDTHKIVKNLEASGYTHGQATVMMKALRALLVIKVETAKAEYLSRVDLANQTYLFKAAMAELRQETIAFRRSRSEALHAELVALQQATDSLEQHISERIVYLNNETAIDVNSYKAGNRAVTNARDISIQELGHKLTVALSRLGTTVERNRWIVTKYYFTGVICFAFMMISIVNVTMEEDEPPDMGKQMSILAKWRAKWRAKRKDWGRDPGRDREEKHGGGHEVEDDGRRWRLRDTAKGATEVAWVSLG
ncbi:hypothetical protein SAICODRAFT_138730 [Saitoella complicata NRRL Y-17804]|uniref:uncharacterized protein n=1 Tax=Saitoella complicata (strain BCRC 22490 / CBS 7301 / JCM 7358 / NBRC 10748 / NRRL Y-17804) TaxID=698492 RepID=UPI000867AD2F|nr:uncharacterized protein SAICODRAFT_138730 [Saitoella complicata NRRL Y-17804]ODQ51855.1 hypothetical protein SAICODRAFT_138730 [Saitoella complicata NRRL Y-17804]